MCMLFATTSISTQESEVEAVVRPRVSPANQSPQQLHGISYLETNSSPLPHDFECMEKMALKGFKRLLKSMCGFISYIYPKLECCILFCFAI